MTFIHKDKQQELVTLSDGFCMGLFQLVTIIWYGRIVEVTTRGRWGEKRIIRTWTEMKWPRKTHPRSTRLRQAPADTLALGHRQGGHRDAAAAPTEGQYWCTGIQSNGLTPPKKQ